MGKIGTFAGASAGGLTQEGGEGTHGSQTPRGEMVALQRGTYSCIPQTLRFGLLLRERGIVGG